MGREARKETARSEEEILRTIFDHIPMMVNFTGKDGRIKLVNREWERTLGWTLEEIERKKIDIFCECFPDPVLRDEARRFIANPSGQWRDFDTRIRDGRTLVTSWFEIGLSDGTTIGLGMDVTERKRMEEELRSSQEQLRALAAYLQSVREEERSRIALELHDHLGQALTGLRLDLSWLSGRLTRWRSQARALIERTKSMISLVDETVEAVRRTATELRPGILDDLGLAAAIEWQAADFQRRTKIRCEVATSFRRAAPDRDVSTAVFRMVQEALTNAARHARATRVRIDVRESDGHLLVEVADDGRGITEAQRSGLGSLGLLGMRERARLLGGELTVSGGPGRGTRITARVPVTLATGS
ncbi:MAG TPA: PAS domain-containing sensor histidine kinase [Candidatus Binatus sp.]|nr:PAS domain-containing sensor histidine kinase [Candidatus Binatus sp.]